MSSRTIKYMLVAASLAMPGYRVAYADDNAIYGTNVWIGASSGGSWADTSNWRAESASGYSVEELFKLNTVYDFRALASGAVVINDCKFGTEITGQKSTKLMMLRGLIFSGEKGATWDLVDGDNSPYNVRFNMPSDIIVEGGTLNFNLAVNGESYPYQCIKKYGDGTLKVMKACFFWEHDPSIDIHGGTMILPSTMNCRNGAIKLSGNGHLAFPSGSMVFGKIYTSSDESKMEVGEGAKIQLVNGHNVAGNGNTYKGDIAGGGELKYCGGNTVSFARGTKTEPLSFTGILELWNADINFGTVDEPQLANEAMTVKPCANGYCVFRADQRIRNVTGGAGSGGILIGNSKMLTVGPKDDGKLESNYFGRFGGSGSLVKDGANYTLNLSGNNNYAGKTIIKAGTLALDRSGVKEHLAAHWNFEDADDIGRDVAFGAMPLKMLLTTATEKPSLVDDGVLGKALHFDGTDKTKGYKLNLDRDNSNPDAVLPLGNAPVSSSFTCSFWMRPNGKGCGAYPNFIHLASREASIESSPSWGGGFYFGSVDLKWGTAETKQPAFSVIGMYFENWSVGGYLDKCVYTEMKDGESLTDGAWHHIAGTYDSANKEAVLYIDGKERARKTLPAAAQIPSKCDISIGNFSGDANHKYAGDLDEIAIYRVAWTAEQVKNEYEAYSRVNKPKMPVPLAHWTFDEAEADGMAYADSGSLGIAMTTVNSSDTAAALAMNKVDIPDKTGHRIKGVQTAAEGSGGKYSNYAAMRLAAGGGEKLKAALPNGSSFTISARTGRCAGEAFLIVGDGSEAGSVKLTHQESPRITRWLAGNTTSHGGNDSVTWMSATLDSNWVHMTIVYDAEENRIRYYFDGTEIESEVRTLNDINFVDVVFGAGARDSTTGNISKWKFDQWGRVEIDDLAIWNVALTPEQIRGHLRNVAGVEAKESVLPATSPVTVERGARLLVRAGEQTAKSVEGAGDVEIFGGASFCADSWEGFSGKIAGAGELVLTDFARIGDGATVTAPVLIKSIKVAADAEKNLPMTTTAKRVKIADAGTFTVADVDRQPYGKKYEIARNVETCELPQDASGWKIYPELPAVKFTFEYRDNTVWAKTGNIGLTIRIQ